MGGGKTPVVSTPKPRGARIGTGERLLSSILSQSGRGGFGRLARPSSEFRVFVHLRLDATSSDRSEGALSEPSNLNPRFPLADDSSARKTKRTTVTITQFHRGPVLRGFGEDTWQFKQGPILIPRGLGLRAVDLKLDVRELFVMTGGGTFGTLGPPLDVRSRFATRDGSVTN